MATIMIATLTIRWGQLERFSELMEKLVPSVETRGWKLLAAYHAVIGDLTKVIDVWEIPDANSVATTLAALAVDEGHADVVAGLRRCWSGRTFRSWPRRHTARS
jgi:hypothetical protein